MKPLLIALAIEKNALKLDARWRRGILWLVPVLAIVLLWLPEGLFGKRL